MAYDHETICLAVGMLLGMFYYHKTGWACGGIITPGVIAMYINDPLKVSVSLAAGVVTWVLLDLLVRLTNIYGRQRLAAAMLIALALRYPLASVWGETSLWLGWVVPGLIGADIQRQGFMPTLAAVISVSIVTVMSVYLFQLVLL
ncbi:MAG: poly-gamma-glutamate biosynthesis protein PgsC/CapC [Gammaproteobacteria bacterium]|nr:poly-gamma-glutamate biosynthesis protein PgsC/CapC [Gammaproteobacteria bacterium]NNK98838.1 capsule biosynthesis protein CapC [Xanthomonadales bacterium]